MVKESEVEWGRVAPFAACQVWAGMVGVCRGAFRVEKEKMRDVM